MTRRSPVDWERYLAEFHRTAAGITEELLGPATEPSGLSPYAWLVSGREDDGRPVLDVGCGSAPTGPGSVRWVGLDRSLGELRRAVAHDRTPVVQGDASSLPFPDACVSTAVFSMALMVVPDPASALAEVRRALRPDGRLLVLIPAAAPMTARDRFRMGTVMVLVGTPGFPFPTRSVLRRTAETITAAGFTVESDETRRFSVPLSGPDEGERFVRSLYLPQVSTWRVRLARRWARRWRGDLGIPLRRIVAHPSNDEGRKPPGAPRA